MDIKSKENIDRITESLNTMKLIIAFGKDAEKVLSEANLKFIPALCHLGTKGLNSIDGNSADEKIQKVADGILEKLISFKLTD